MQPNSREAFPSRLMLVLNYFHASTEQENKQKVWNNSKVKINHMPDKTHNIWSISQLATRIKLIWTICILLCEFKWHGSFALPQSWPLGCSFFSDMCWYWIWPLINTVHLEAANQIWECEMSFCILIVVLQILVSVSLCIISLCHWISTFINADIGLHQTMNPVLHVRLV